MPLDFSYIFHLVCVRGDPLTIVEVKVTDGIDPNAPKDQRYHWLRCSGVGQSVEVSKLTFVRMGKSGSRNEREFAEGTLVWPDVEAAAAGDEAVLGHFSSSNLESDLAVLGNDAVADYIESAVRAFLSKLLNL